MIGRGPSLAAALAASSLLLCAPVAAEPLRIVAWNTESGDADADVLAEFLAESDGVALWGLSEVLPSWAETFRRAAATGEAGRFEMALGSTGGADRLLVLYDADRLEAIARFELHELNPQRRVRSPLVVHFRERDGDVEFLFMVNHLYRSRAERRHEQSRGLRTWAERQTLPVIAVGDFNYDWRVENGDADHDAGYDELVAGDTFAWVRPERLVPTHCSHHASILDFVFASGVARHWNPTSRILESQPEYCPDDDTGSDHRPLFASFDLGLAGRLALRDASLERIDRMQHELARLRALVERFE